MKPKPMLGYRPSSAPSKHKPSSNISTASKAVLPASASRSEDRTARENSLSLQEPRLLKSRSLFRTQIKQGSPRSQSFFLCSILRPNLWLYLCCHSLSPNLSYRFQTHILSRPSPPFRFAEAFAEDFAEDFAAAAAGSFFTAAGSFFTAAGSFGSFFATAGKGAVDVFCRLALKDVQLLLPDQVFLRLFFFFSLLS